MEITEKELSLFSFFEGITHVMPSDFNELGEMLVFVVEQERLGQAIGKNGANIEKLKAKLKKKILIVADSKDPETFIKNYFNNLKIFSIEPRDVMGEKEYMVTLDEKDRGIAIGRDGERIKSLKAFLKKKFNAGVHLRTRRVMFDQSTANE